MHLSDIGKLTLLNEFNFDIGAVLEELAEERDGKEEDAETINDLEFRIDQINSDHEDDINDLKEQIFKLENPNGQAN